MTEGFSEVETKEGTTMSTEKAGLACCKSPVSLAKKLLAELHSDDGMSQIMNSPLRQELISSEPRPW